MPCFEAFALTGKSSKWSSRGSDGRTRTCLLILARLARRNSVTGISATELSINFELESFIVSSIEKERCNVNGTHRIG